MRKSWATTDTILLGRKTWEFAQAQGGGGEMPGVTVKAYVFSRTLKSISGQGHRAGHERRRRRSCAS